MLLALGGPNVCLGVDPDDIDTVNDGDGTWDHPRILRRDNLAVGGQLEVTDPTVTAEVSEPFLSDGVWKNLTGHFQFSELREHGWLYADQFTPILPGGKFHGPGAADYATRAGIMVHGNRYGLSMYGATEGGDQYVLEDIEWVALSDDILLVPVVVVLWKTTDTVDSDFDLSTYWTARNMFDFQPLHMSSPLQPYERTDGTQVVPLPLASTQVLFATEIDSPSDYWLADMAPDRDEIPPDELWATCGIQFQVVGQFIVSLPKGWTNPCNILAQNFGDPEWEVPAELAYNPALASYLVDDLQPIYVSYGPLECYSFVATTPGKGRFIEINWDRPPIATAHELGHSLGLEHATDDNGDPVDGNLMREGPKYETKLTDEQCDEARKGAALFSERYDDFNWWTGRTFSDEVPPPPSGADDGGSAGTDTGFDPGDQGDQVCCQGERDVVFTAARDCTAVVATEMCDTVCCSNGNVESRYLCDQQGGTAMRCPGPN